MIDSLEFEVRGLPIPQGTARAFVAPGKAGGKPRAILTTEANRPKSPLGAWRIAIQAAARDAIGQAPALDCPVAVRVEFVFPRPASHYLSANGRRPMPELRLDAPVFHSGTPDVDKLSRALLDGLTNVAITDDSRVADLHASKLYETDDRRPGCWVRIRRLAATR